MAKCTALGVTPASNSIDDILSAIDAIYKMGTSAYTYTEISLYKAGATNQTATFDVSSYIPSGHKLIGLYNPYPRAEFSDTDGAGTRGYQITISEATIKLAWVGSDESYIHMSLSGYIVTVPG